MSHQNSSPDQNNNSTNEMPWVRINNLVQGMFKYETGKILDYNGKIDSWVEWVMIKAMEWLFRVGVNFNHGQFMTAANDPKIPRSPVVSKLIQWTTTNIASHSWDAVNDSQINLAA